MIRSLRIINTRMLPRISVRRYAAAPVYTKVGNKAPATAKSYSKPAPPAEEEDSSVGSEQFPEAPSKSTSKSFTLSDSPPMVSSSNGPGHVIDWLDSFAGLGSMPFPREVADILLAPIEDEDIELKPDGMLYLPEIKYRRILNRAFGPGGWGLAPRTELLITEKQITREYALVCHGRLVSVARGEQDYFGGEDKITTALEGCKSNALMRCCKDLGIASELWDPAFIRKWKRKNSEEVWVEYNKRNRKIFIRKGESVEFPYKLIKK